MTALGEPGGASPSIPHGTPNSALDESLSQGLGAGEAQRRLRDEGANELPTSQSRTVARITLEVLREPMFLLLVAAGTLYLTMGEPADALMLLGFVVVVMAITIVQERRTERALEALRDLSSPRALVLRDGQRQRIAGRDVVRGDILVLCEGDRVPADALLRRATALTVDESLLTGESNTVRKRASAEQRELDRPGGDDLASVFAGALITGGEGLAEVINTGSRTVLGGIGRALQTIETAPTPLQQETARIVRAVAVLALSACAFVAFAYGYTRGGTWPAWKQGLLAGIAMAMSLLPEEFPVVLTVFLALGAWRISRNRVLTRRMPVIEALGAATVLCVDKTGTLTRNDMTVRVLWAEGTATEVRDGTDSLPAAAAQLLRTAALASKSDPFDPMERALQRVARQTQGPGLPPRAHLVHEYALTHEFLAVSRAWQSDDDAALEIATKGAPEAVLSLCRLTGSERERVLQDVATLAAKGLRVLAVAREQCSSGDLPGSQSALRLHFCGLVGFEDPLRTNVPAAVAECYTAGLRIVMITGDYPETARSIARQAGLGQSVELISGSELAAMSDEELSERIQRTRVFARVVPEQKLRIVQALKRKGEIVAMTGDGVNDSPALKAAHIGIAMGGRGTDVAREAASLVLLDDDFSSIVTAVRLGRRIFDNIGKAVGFIVAVHVPIAGLSILPVFKSQWPLILLPMHIAFLELIIGPSCALIFEAEEPDANIMRRPPRNPTERLFSFRSLALSFLQGAGVFAVCVASFVLSLPSHGALAARALTFATLIVGLLCIILVNRSHTHSMLQMLRRPNSAFWWVLCGAAVVLFAILTVPVLQRRFAFGPLHLSDLFLSLSAGVLCLLWFEILKYMRRRGSATEAVANRSASH